MPAVFWRLMAVVAIIATACDSAPQREGQPTADPSVTSPNSGPAATAPIPTLAEVRPAVTVTPSVVAGWWDGHEWISADGKRPVTATGGETYSIPTGAVRSTRRLDSRRYRPMT